MALSCDDGSDRSMIPRECKRLAEVDFPIAAVSRHAVREKRFPVPRGLPSTMHHWWARRPLASCRAVLLALLWPDPCDRLCPRAFKEKARGLLPAIPNCKPGSDDLGLRSALLRFIADFADWKLAAHPDYLRVSRALVESAQCLGGGGAAAGGRSVRRRRVDPAGGATAGLRNVRQRLESSRLPDPQGIA